MEQHLVEECRQTLRKNNLRPIKKLGKGGFGIVYLVSKNPSNNYEQELYSVKCTSKKQFLKKPLLRKYLKQEISILESLQHENIVRLIRSFEDDGWIFMVMEYCDLGNLAMIQKQRQEGVFAYEQMAHIIQQVIKGIEYMHNLNVIHRDIKPQNILRSKHISKTITKICDLGFSRQAKDDLDTFCGTTYYMAPEIFSMKKYDKKVDIWALGVLIFTMIFGHVPFKALNMEAEINDKCHDGFDISFCKKKENSSLDQKKIKILNRLFRHVFMINPQKRATLKDILGYLGKSNSIEWFSSKSSGKQKTIDTESQEDFQLSFEMEKVNFIQEVFLQIEELNFLTEIETLFLKYYLDKVCQSILEQIDFLKRNEDQKIALRKFKENLKKNSLLIERNKDISGISEYRKVYKSQIFHNFNQYKEEYRIVVGHAFHQAHKKISSIEQKIRAKLKIFCCHVINRVFEENYRKTLFAHYYNWKEKKGKNKEGFDLMELKKWMEEEKIKRINETVDLINNRFYRKNK